MIAPTGVKLVFLLLILSSMFPHLGLRASEQPEDNRSFIVSVDGKPYQFDVADIKKLGVKSITVNDPVYQQRKTYLAVPLYRILQPIKVSNDSWPLIDSVVFISSDGYQVDTTLERLENSAFEPHLALSSDSDGESRWQPYLQGEQWISFDPFYLVWVKRDFKASEDVADLPWPYQLTEIRLSTINRLSYIEPHGTDSEDIKRGYALFMNRCLRCHQISGIGGKLGPDLLRDQGMVIALRTETLVDMIRNIKKYYPESKMPVYLEDLSSEDAEAVLNYLRSR